MLIPSCGRSGPRRGFLPHGIRPHSTGPMRGAEPEARVHRAGHPRWCQGGARVLPDDEDALGQLPGPLPKRMAVVVSIEGAMLWARARVSTVGWAAQVLCGPLLWAKRPAGQRGLIVLPRVGGGVVRGGRGGPEVSGKQGTWNQDFSCLSVSPGWAPGPQGHPNLCVFESGINWCSEGPTRVPHA